jgi:predicted Zn-dependent protease
MLRLNTSIAPVPFAAQNRLAIVGSIKTGGSDFAGFPNGRRPKDDVVDIALVAMLGGLCNLPMHLQTLRPLLTATLLALAGLAAAAPLQPTSDAQVIETLAAPSATRAEDRKLRRQWAANPRDAGVAVALARRYLEQAHAEGDPRFAGRALAALQAWDQADPAPPAVQLTRATVLQYLHQFDAAAALLQSLLQREPLQAQAWLTLATVRRVQGRYPESDRACAGLTQAGAALYAQACQAENDGLRGQFDAARARFTQLLAPPQLPGVTRNWLLTSLAELEARAGRAEPAEAAYRAALAAQSDDYTRLSFADFLMLNQRDAEALQLLSGQARSDAVLLRLAIAGRRAAAAQAAADVRELRERMAQANQRPGAAASHAREQAMFALWIDQQPARALALARANVALQREAIDVLLLAQAARASGQPQALREAAALRESMGLKDVRLDALL